MHTEKFLSWLHDEGRDGKTIKAYDTAIRQFLDWYAQTSGRDDLVRIKPIDIKDYLGSDKKGHPFWGSLLLNPIDYLIII